MDHLAPALILCNGLRSSLATIGPRKARPSRHRFDAPRTVVAATLPAASLARSAVKSHRSKRRNPAEDKQDLVRHEDCLGPPCPGCGLSFLTPAELFEHVQDCCPQYLEPEGDDCPGCGRRFRNLDQHMRSCCPELMPQRADREGYQQRQRELSRNDWLSDEEVNAAAEEAINGISDKFLRLVMKLRFGMDRGWKRRTPREVGELLGGRYMRRVDVVQETIEKAQKAIPLKADDPSNLCILHEDEEILAVSKPPFLRTTPIHRFVGKSLVSQLVGYLQPANGSTPPFITQRLDQFTSGVYLCAKTRKAGLFLQREWHRCQKEYLAIAWCTDRAQTLLPSVGDSELVTAALGKDKSAEPGSSRQCVDNENGKPATTEFKVLAAEGRVRLLSCTLREQGRLHQIRVHAAHIGMPLLGDDFYGAEAGPEAPAFGRAALHSWRARIAHPLDRPDLELEAPLPEDLRSCIAKLGLSMPP